MSVSLTSSSFLYLRGNWEKTDSLQKRKQVLEDVDLLPGRLTRCRCPLWLVKGCDSVCVCLSGRTRPPVSPQEQGGNIRQGGEGGRHEPVSRSGPAEDPPLGVDGGNWELVSCCRFWRRLSRCMSKINPEPNLIHIMGCYVLGNPNGEKVRPSSLVALDLQTCRNPDLQSSRLSFISALFQQLFQKLKNLMRPFSVEFESPLELSAQGGSSSSSCSGQTYINKWMNEQMNEWINQWHTQSVNEWTNESVNQSFNEVMSLKVLNHPGHLKVVQVEFGHRIS